jgi:hypothetical protein
LDVDLNGYEGYRAWGWGKQFIYVFPALEMVVAITHDTQGYVSDTSLNDFVRDYVIGALDLAPGDYNGDTLVDEQDFLFWRQSYGTSVSPAGAGADGNGDGLVNAADYSFWRDSLIGGPPGSGSSVPVPEPTTAVLAAWLVALVLWKRRF